MGGVNLSFYDWYCDLPPASPEIWGEQTDVAESADWYNSKFIAVMGSNLNMTRTPDCHFRPRRATTARRSWSSRPTSARSQVRRQWVPIHAGQDGAFWMAVNHVILREFHHDTRRASYFLDYLQASYTDSPFLVVLDPTGRGTYRPGSLLRANAIGSTQGHRERRLEVLVMDRRANARMPGGTVGHRWQSKKRASGTSSSRTERRAVPSTPALLPDQRTTGRRASTTSPNGRDRAPRNVPVRWHTRRSTARCSSPPSTTCSWPQYGVSRGLEGRLARRSYDDEAAIPTRPRGRRSSPASAATVIQFAREWAVTAEKTGGKCSIIIGAGINHWYHNNLIYRAGINA
jgi:nitrate reductase alpha subunit